MRNWLFVPSLARGNGSGHFTRCARFAEASGGMLYLPRPADPRQTRSGDELIASYPGLLSGVRVVGDENLPATLELIVLDLRTCSGDELALWETRGPVVAIDEGGEARERAPYVVDILPSLDSREANAELPGLLEFPKRVRGSVKSVRRLLLSFGGEDEAEIGPRVAKALIDLGLRGATQRDWASRLEITLVNGALRDKNEQIVQYYDNDAGCVASFVSRAAIPNLRELLHEYDCVVTHFGLTAMEARAAGVPVVLANPSVVHERLGRKAGFASLGLIRKGRAVDAARLLALFARIESGSESVAEGAKTRAMDPVAFFTTLATQSARHCPLCAGSARRAVARFVDKSYFRCLACGMLYETRFGSLPEYGKDYFQGEYKAQYGKTYLEDAMAIRAACLPRMGIISELVGARSFRGSAATEKKPVGMHGAPLLLDVGCAYGVFMQVARESGFEPRGNDISDAAVEYVRDSLGFKASVGDFTRYDPEGVRFDCVTMWYVIEHFEDLAAALSKASSLLAAGGVFAFSTPSASGVSAKTGFRRFLERSPADHYTVWEPERCAALLARFGFGLERIRVTGHHPERFPWAKTGFAKKIASLYSKALGLGDTFEAYARKF